MGDRARRVFLAAALISWAGAALAENWKTVKGEAARALFAGKEFGDGVHFAYRFRTDGSFAGTEMGKDVRGSWRVMKDEMCWKWTRPSGTEECYDLQKNGAEIRLRRNGFEAWYGTLKP
jgi:hypothetical protein